MLVFYLWNISLCYFFIGSYCFLGCGMYNLWMEIRIMLIFKCYLLESYDFLCGYF